MADPAVARSGFHLPAPEGEAGVRREETGHLPVIRRLDSQTINQIAAGEVVERPASAVKELVENALDAGATRIEIDLERAGRALIRVSDNGIGMTEDQVLLALERHATSKITRAEDLLAVSTMGFRGEALPTLASVSKFRLSSGVAHGARVVVTAHGGQVQVSSGDAGPRGTTVSMEDLFFNVPARLKFLRTDATELSAIVDAVSRHAIARPDVAFTLRHAAGGPAHEALRTSGSGDFATTLQEVWGRDLTAALLPVDHYQDGVRLTGMVSPPHVSRATRTHQWLWVNGRPVRSKTLMAAIDQAFRAWTPERRFPLAALMIWTDPAGVDVNVSPTKSEVKFRDESTVFRAMVSAIKRAVAASGMVPGAEAVHLANEAARDARGDLPAGSPPEMPWGPGAFGMSQRAQAPLGSEESTAWLGAGTLFARPFAGGSSGLADGVSLGAAGGVTGVLPDLLHEFRLIGQWAATFILGDSPHGLIVIDQHVAHERILYERLWAERARDGVPVQPLLSPETLHLSRASALIAQQNLAELARAGFDVEPFGPESFLVRGVPAIWRGRSPLSVLRDVLDELAEGRAAGCLGTGTADVFAMAACKMAVKAGDPLAEAEMKKLVEDLATLDNPFFCPHGRPITILIPTSDIARRFKR